EQNDAKAQYNLGVCYEKGEGVGQVEAERARLFGMAGDPVEAVKWYRKAAEQNYATAQNNLGLCYEQGKGVAKDLVEAPKWYRKAAEQNDATAQLYLGLCYVRGDGVAEDLVEAYKWLLLAARQGDEQAKKIVTDLKNALRPEQIAQGQKRARVEGVAKDQVEAVK